MEQNIKNNQSIEEKKVMLVAAENGAINGAKVGGMADVIRDLPPALIEQNVQADVAMPDYGFIASDNQAQFVANVEVPYAGRIELVKLYKMPRPQLPASASAAEHDAPQPQVYIFSHPLFNHPQLRQGQRKVYTESHYQRPFADDANKFALFCLSVASAFRHGLLADYQVLHLHDWHTAMLAMLRSQVDEFAVLKTMRCVYTIHNLAIQGVRPFSHDESSFCHWFKPWFSEIDLTKARELKLLDPRYDNCINPMRIGIAHSDCVHIVSPSYAQEVTRASDSQLGFIGGEGLEQDLVEKQHQGQLIGIINGCFYHDACPSVEQKRAYTSADNRQSLFNLIQDVLIEWQGTKEQVSACDFIAANRLRQWQRQDENKQSKSPLNLYPPGLVIPHTWLLTSVGRLTSQKVALLLYQVTAEHKTLELMLLNLEMQHPKAKFILLGSGDAELAKQMQQIAAKHANLLFLNGYHELLSEQLYQQGELFIMPSSFEPCGISQMLAMKQYQPCLVHAVGGLKDTVIDKQTGWQFSGDNPQQQAEQLLRVFDECLASYGDNDWLAIREKAGEQRFTWQQVAIDYCQQLYRFEVIAVSGTEQVVAHDA
ncbi:glycogen synthase [Shewanella maritima]|uniref:starch synthase n=1 Tax=Shewanella maritima TaxID=2520507 RepID=A0A411PKI0_9GAMM|nr:glycogen/starch synthase [Shewanella maritima]QBF84028.1 glycogen synthase [Shewanella maritima]